MPPSLAASVSVRCLPQCPGWVPVPMMAVHAEPGLLTGCKCPAPWTRPSLTLGSGLWGPLPEFAGSSSPLSCPGRLWSGGSHVEARCCRPCRDSGPLLPTGCFLFMLQPGLPEAAALGQGFPLQGATPFSSGFYSPRSGWQRQDPVTDVSGCFIFITSSASRRRKLRLQGLNVI